MGGTNVRERQGWVGGNQGGKSGGREGKVESQEEAAGENILMHHTNTGCRQGSPSLAAKAEQHLLEGLS